MASQAAVIKEAYVAVAQRSPLPDLSALSSTSLQCPDPAGFNLLQIACILGDASAGMSVTLAGGCIPSCSPGLCALEHG